MIFRYAVYCPGCEAKIVLRLGVGLDNEQPFFFVCKACKAVTKGRLVIWYKPKIGHRLELEEGEMAADDSDPAQVVTLNPDFPSLADATEMWDAGGSPFLLQQQIMRGRFLEWHNRLGLFRSWADREWPALRRLIGYYLDGNWQQFDAEGQRLLEENWPEPYEDWHRHDCLHRILDIAFVPLWVDRIYPDMKQAWFEGGLPPHADAKKTAEFARESVESGQVAECQRAVFHCLELYVENRGAILPGLAVGLYPKSESEAIRDLRLLRDDFAGLRDLFVASFEACHKTLRFVVGQINIARRSNANAFADARPKDLDLFDRLPNAEKAKRVEEIPVLQGNWQQVLDRQVRNAISHHSVRHDLSEGVLAFQGLPHLPYLEFVVKTFRLIHPILFAAHALKTMHVMALLGQGLLDRKQKGARPKG